MQHCQGKLGAMYFQTPSDVIRPFVDANKRAVGNSCCLKWLIAIALRSFTAEDEVGISQ